jgi:hypothetical protein
MYQYTDVEFWGAHLHILITLPLRRTLIPYRFMQQSSCLFLRIYCQADRKVWLSTIQQFNNATIKQSDNLSTLHCFELPTQR